MQTRCQVKSCGQRNYILTTSHLNTAFRVCDHQHIYFFSFSQVEPAWGSGDSKTKKLKNKSKKSSFYSDSESSESESESGTVSECFVYIRIVFVDGTQSSQESDMVRADCIFIEAKTGEPIANRFSRVLIGSAITRADLIYFRICSFDAVFDFDLSGENDLYTSNKVAF